ncbi:MAG: OmpA family protein [Bacteroidales bacterium]
MKRFIYISEVLLLSALMLGNFSCVSSKKYNELLSKSEACTKKSNKLDKENQQLGVNLTECKSLSDRLGKELENSTTELDTLRRNYQVCSEELQSLQHSYDQIDSKYKTTVSGKDALAQKLNQKESELKEKAALLAEKEKRVNELQEILDKKVQEMNALKDKVNDALLGFKDKGLSVYTKNGKVYVSMDEKLLFASGSWTVGPQGREALYEVSNILAKNPDIQVLVEGHTDNVPLKSKGDIQDNWDLSVMRATSIVKILLENKGVNPGQITAAGRGEFVPLVSNDIKENRAKNRRTEIILTPKLNELFQILGN